LPLGPQSLAKMDAQEKSPVPNVVEVGVDSMMRLEEDRG
jgi:hypothetical protein